MYARFYRGLSFNRQGMAGEARLDLEFAARNLKDAGDQNIARRAFEKLK